VPKRSGRKEVAIPPNNRAPHALKGASNIRTLSARYIADLQDHWEKHGRAALDEYREKFVDRYVENYAMLTRVIKVEADVKHSLAKPKTVDEALAELESRVGKEGRRKFEKFLREVANDEDDVTPKHEDDVTPK
jgi:hypothetical protein